MVVVCCCGCCCVPLFIHTHTHPPISWHAYMHTHCRSSRIGTHVFSRRANMDIGIYKTVVRLFHSTMHRERSRTRAAVYISHKQLTHTHMQTRFSPFTYEYIYTYSGSRSAAAPPIVFTSPAESHQNHKPAWHLML